PCDVDSSKGFRGVEHPGPNCCAWLAQIEHPVQPKPQLVDIADRRLERVTPECGGEAATPFRYRDPDIAGKVEGRLTGNIPAIVRKMAGVREVEDVMIGIGVDVPICG